MCVAAFAVRLFAVLRFESVIHEFDPYFNYRATKFLVEHGMEEFVDWFDSSVWYPLGRAIGATIYPGMMATAALVHGALHALRIDVDVRVVCVFLAPCIAAATVLVVYAIARRVRGESAGLVAAGLVALVPGYVSRSVAGSYDNEGVAIFALLLTAHLWMGAVATGSLLQGAACAVAYAYMAAAWGGYVYALNLIALHVAVLAVTGRMSPRLYTAYSSFYVLGQSLAMQVPFIGFQVVQGAEHMPALAVFVALQVTGAAAFVRRLVSPVAYDRLMTGALSAATALGATVLGYGYFTGFFAPITGRVYSMLDPTYAIRHVPIIASVSEHQPAAWGSFFFDLHAMTFLTPVGMYYCFKTLGEEDIFVLLYGITSVYFAGVMVRLMLVFAPAACILSGIAISTVLDTYMAHLAETPETRKSLRSVRGAKNASDTANDAKREVAYVMVFGMSMLLSLYVLHCVWVTSEAYSAPSIVLSAKQADGSRMLFDDFREAYSWLAHNTAEDARVASWWDYGYQLSALANRTIFVDNNTWNNTHIGRIGQIFCSKEEEAAALLRDLGADYVLVVFGALTGFRSDDLNKLLWMVRMGEALPGAPVVETDYVDHNKEFRVDGGAPPALLDSLVYKMSYHRFGEVVTDPGKPGGFDRVRGTVIGRKDISFEHFEEAYTSEHWLVRIYRVRGPNNRR